MISIQAKKHDNFAVEFKCGFNCNVDGLADDFAVNAWIFVPNSLDINPENYGKKQFYRDIKSNVRLITPTFTLRELAKESSHPLQSLTSAINSIVASPFEDSVIDTYEYHLKMYSAIFKSALRDQAKDLMSSCSMPDATDLVVDYATSSRKVLSRFRDLFRLIDSPDIPLNVSRSYLQSDANVKKISTYITKKVADRLDEIFKNERQQFEEKWDNLKIFIEFGMLTDEKFCERAMKFVLLKNTDSKYFSIEDYKTAIAGEQTDKDGKVVFLYATDVDSQYSFIEAAKSKGYDVLLMDCHLDSHFVQLLENKIENCRFARVDSDSIDNLIPKADKEKPVLSEADQEDISVIFQAVLPKENQYFVQADNLGSDAAPILITQSEFMRRYREMSAMGGGMNFYGEMPAMYNITVNMENPLVGRIMDAAAGHKDDLAGFAGQNEILRQVTDLALLANGMLKGKDLSDFIARSAKVVEDAYL